MEKLNNVSLLRLIATIMILGHHIICYNFGLKQEMFYVVPLYIGVNIFIFISAWLYGQKEKKDYKKMFKKLLTPFFIAVTMIFIYMLLTGMNENVYSNLWYVYAILICYAIMPILDRCKTNKKWFGVLALVVAGELALSTFVYQSQVVITEFIIVYLLAGKVVKKWWLNWLVFAICYVGYYFLGNYTGTPSVVLQCIITFGSTFLSMLLLNGLEFTNKYKMTWLKYTDKYSYEFYLIQQLAISIALLMSGGWVGVLLAVEINILLAIILKEIERCLNT